MLKNFKIIFALALLAGGLCACAQKEVSQKEAKTPSEAIAVENTIKQEKDMYVLLKTNKGDIVLELNAEKAPQTVENFVKYVNDGHYNGTIFHRVIKGFMIQGGGFDADMNQKQTRSPIMNEADNGLKNDKYTIAMARTSDPDSATAQFFINSNDNDFLNFRSQTMQGWGYAVFGKVVAGENVVDAIEVVPTTRKFPHDDVPVQPVVIEKAEVLKDYKPAK